MDAALRAVLVGEDRLNRPGAPQERRITAFHEAGHALATLLFDPQSRLARVSIIPSTRGAAGYSMAVPPDRMLLTRAQAEAAVCVALAGRAAEELVFGRAGVTTGAANDLARATELTGRMCLEWGMDEKPGCVCGRRWRPGPPPAAMPNPWCDKGWRRSMSARARGWTPIATRWTRWPKRCWKRNGWTAARRKPSRAKMSDESHPKRITRKFRGRINACPKGKRLPVKGGMCVQERPEAGTRGVSANRDTVTVQIEGELDHCSAERVRASLDALIEDVRVKRLVIDLQHLTSWTARASA